MSDVVASLNPGRELSDFFDFFYESQSGYVYSPLKQPESGEWHQAFFQWPEQKAELIKHVQQNAADFEVYFAPALFDQPNALKEHVKGTYVFWAEFDGNVPATESLGDIPMPTLRVRSSEQGHEHFYWRLDYFEVDTQNIERVNRGIAYRLNADTSGWDANQILRPVTTINHKRGKSVLMLSRSETRYSSELFSVIPEPPQYVKQDIELDTLPAAQDVVAKYKWDEEAWEFFKKKDIPVGSRSSAMMRLAYYCAEMRMSDEEAYSILDNADRRWGKFIHRTDRVKRLLDAINRARIKYPLNLTENGTVLDEFPVFDFQSFIDSEITVEWIIPGVLERAGLVLLSGPPGTGKTQLSLQFCIHMAIGKSFLGWDMDKPRKIMFISMEMGHAALKFFVEQMAAGYTEEERQLLARNLFLVPLGTGVMLDSPAEQAKVVRLVQKYNPDGVIFDSLGVATTDELSSEGTTKTIMDYVARLRAEYDLFVWFIHHNRKAQSANKKPSKLADIYGSVYVTAAPTTVIGLWPVKRQIELSGLKIRLSEPFKFVIRRTENLNFEISTAGDKLLASMEKEQDDDFTERSNVFDFS